MAWEAWARLLEPIVRWTVSEDGYAEWKKRRALGRAKTHALRALHDHDWAALRARVAELERLSSQP